MVRLRGFKGREEVEVSKSALGERTTGDITVVITGETLDANIIYLGCHMAKGTNRKVHLLHVIEVPRTLPLKSVLTQASERADILLNAAQAIAERVGCKALSEVVQARDAGRAIVEEVKDHKCALLIVGLILPKQQPKDIGKTMSYILNNASCRVWLVADPTPGQLS